MKQITTCLFLLYFNAGLAQPVIVSSSPKAGPIGSVVSISGSNFNNTPANNIVFFGATRAKVIAASATKLQVVVPVGATYGQISLMANGFNCHSPFPFDVISGQILTDSSFNARTDFSFGIYPSFIARGDLDGDGKPDMVVSNFSSNDISVFHNTCTPGNISFSLIKNYLANPEPEGIKIDDINGDGKPDVIGTSINGHLFSVWLNESVSANLVLASRQDFILGNSFWPRGVATGDIDGDGKVDVVTADNNKIIDFTNNTSHGTVSVSRNVSGVTSLSFEPPVSFNTGDYSRSVLVADIDGDGKPDVATANQGDNSVSVFLNNSTLGNIDLSLQQTLALSGNGEQITMGDIDGDGNIDLIVSNLTGTPLVSVFRNTSSRGLISFALPVTIATGGPLGISVGDIDGDGKPDLAVANYNTGYVSVLKNTSSPGNISFAQRIDFSAGNSLVDVKIGDVDGDSIPDLTVTNANDNIVSVLTKKPPHYLLNLGNDTTICEGDSITLKANIPNAQYLWNTGDTADHIAVTKTGIYNVKVTVGDTNVFDTIVITANPKPIVFLGNDTLICSGDSRILNAFNSGATYLWSDGSQSSSIKVTTTGTYFVTVSLQGCLQSDTLHITYDSLPKFTPVPNMILCSGQSLVLNPGIISGNFLWQDGSTSPVLTITHPGTYLVIISNNCGSATGEFTVTEGNCNVYFPSAFTPNGDQLNDVFKPAIYGQVTSFQMQIFDRWGKLVFKSNDASLGWNGTFNGFNYPAGVYVWQCTYQLRGKSVVSKKGTLTLLR